MSTFKKHFAMGAILILTVFFGSARVVRAGAVAAPRRAECRNLPVIKNLTGLKAQHVCEKMTASNELTKREILKLTATAKAPEDHLTIARYYSAEANGLDARAEAYEKAAANLRRGPVGKNFMASGTPAHFEFAAKGFRDEAKADRVLGASHAKMANSTTASLR